MFLDAEFLFEHVLEVEAEEGEEEEAEEAVGEVGVVGVVHETSACG